MNSTNYTETCLPSPKKRYSPYLCRPRSNIKTHPYPSSLINQETVQSSLNSEDSLHSADEAGDRSAWAGGWGQEFDPDIGYCSHSTSSSSHNIDQATELEYCQSYQLGCSEVGGDGQGPDKAEDVVQQFGKFFQGQFRQVFHQFQSSMHCMLDEQQDHLRHIINFFTKFNQGSSEDLRVEQSSLPCLGSTREQESSLTTYTGYSLEEMDALPPLDESDYPEFYLAPDARPSGTSSVYAQNTFGCDFLQSEQQLGIQSSSEVSDSSKDRLLLHVYSLTCGVNNLLNRPEFKT